LSLYADFYQGESIMKVKTQIKAGGITASGAD